MPISLSDTKLLKARLQHESDPRGTYAEFDAEEARAKLKQGSTQSDESDEDSAIYSEDDNGADDDGYSSSEDAAAAAAELEAEEADDADPIDPELEARLIAEVRAEHAKLDLERRRKKLEKKEQARQQQEHALAINFAKRLAHNDKKVRDASVKSLRRWLVRRETLDSTDLLKIWKGLFYCFWMSDKVPVQQALADSLSDLLLPPLPFERALLLFDSCLLTLRREWTAIDQLRMDKFMSLARKFVQKIFLCVQGKGWSTEEVEQLTDVILQSSVLSPDTEARGFAFHITDCFLPELERISANQPEHAVTFDALNILLTPFYHILARAKDNTIVDRVKKEVFDPLRELCGTPVLVEEEQQQSKPSKKQQEQKAKEKQQKSKKSKKVSKESDEYDEADEDEDEVDEEEGQEDDVQHPQLEGAAAEFPYLHQVVFGNADKIAEVLGALATDAEILNRSRKLLYSYRGDFIDAQERSMEEPVPEEEEPVIAAPVQSKKTKGQKRKASTDVEEGEQDSQTGVVVGRGSESLAEPVQQAAKKRNKKQRLADKRRKTQALLGAEPLAQAQAQEEQDENQDADEEYGADHGDFDADGDMYMGSDEEDGDGNDDQYDDDVDMDQDLDVSHMEAMEDPSAAAIPVQSISKKERKRLEAAKLLLQQQKAQGDKKGKKRVAPQAVRDEDEAEEEEEREPEPEQPKKKKQRLSNQPTLIVEPEPQPLKQPKKVKQRNQPTIIAEPESEEEPERPPPKQQPKSALKKPQHQPSSPSLQPTTPPKPKQSTNGSSTSTAPSAGFSTPQAKSSSTTSHTIQVGGTVVRVAPPSSSKKNVRIELANNQVKQFKKWSRDSITTETSQLLAKPSPKSAIKAASIEYFLEHNKNGREHKARQSLLAKELKEAGHGVGSPSSSKSSKGTPPTSPRPKAADYFFKE